MALHAKYEPTQYLHLRPTRGRESFNSGTAFRKQILSVQDVSSHEEYHSSEPDSTHQMVFGCLVGLKRHAEIISYRSNKTPRRLVSKFIVDACQT